MREQCLVAAERLAFDACPDPTGPTAGGRSALRFVPSLFQPYPEPTGPGAAITQAAVLLVEAERPIILAGGGALWSDAGPEIKALAKQLEAPVVTTLNAKGLLDERDPVSLGHARSVRAKAVLPHADLMLAVGCRFTEVMTDWRRLPVPQRLDPD